MPSNERTDALEIAEAFVPPFPIGRIPETCDVSDDWPERFACVRQLLAIEKHPEASVIPVANVDVAVPVCAKFKTEIGPEKVEVPAPCTMIFPVVVAAPETVSPPAAVPLPIVDEAVEIRPPAKVRSVVVEFPTNGYPNVADGSA